MLKLTLLSLASALTLATLAPSSEAHAYGEVYVQSGAYAGARVQVYTGDAWVEATILDVSDGNYLVRYLDPSWGDEWVDASQVSVGSAPAYYQPAVQIYYGSRWYDGTLLASRGGRYQVRYRGVTEWIGGARLHNRRGGVYVAPHAGHRRAVYNGGGRHDGRGFGGGHGTRGGNHGGSGFGGNHGGGHGASGGNHGGGSHGGGSHGGGRGGHSGGHGRGH